jgi:hypothetical protein
MMAIGGDGSLLNLLPRLSSNHDPPDLNLSSSYDYRHDPQCPAWTFI